MILNYSLHDNSANIAMEILNRGCSNLEMLLQRACGDDYKFTYVACPDFSFSLRQRRLILGLPIGGYVKWIGSRALYPLELDMNSCGVHVIKLPEGLCVNELQNKLFNLKQKMDNGEIICEGKTLKWNFTKRNHFINLYKNSNDALYLISHSSSETILFDWDRLHSMFDVKYEMINQRNIPYIIDNDAKAYIEIAKKENEFFFTRHKCIFNELLGTDTYETMYADQHFGMIDLGEILMGCSKLKKGDVFPLLTQPSSNIQLARIISPPDEILALTNGYALVPHGLGMSLPDQVVDIVPCKNDVNYVEVLYENGCRMVTDTLEYMGVSYRNPNVISEMKNKVGFEIEDELMPVLCTKL